MAYWGRIVAWVRRMPPASLPACCGIFPTASALSGRCRGHNSACPHYTPVAPVHPNPAQRFTAELLPRIIERLHRLSHGTLHGEVLPPEIPNEPGRLRVWAPARANAGRFAYPLDITLSWDSWEVDRLFATGGETRFAEYLDALAGKLDAWQEPRQFDINTRTQADPTVLIGGLDFEHLMR